MTNKSVSILCRGAKEVHVVEALRGPALDGMLGRLYNVKQSVLFQHSFLANTVTVFLEHGEHILKCQCDYCGADLTCSFEVKRVLQAVHHGKLDPATLLTRFAHHNMVGQQGGTFSCRATLA